ncbi:MULTISPECIES: hypothetical protein [Bacillus cereus group]|uniref:Uncharacterized protein n=2 Tax=Bacillus cereus group TaxID=86661 RepID=A0A9X6ZPR3_BACTU|nr:MULTISPECIES: hypothetical protein [Bacillus cereus group]MDA1674962.1 hypothetical protein [Bacillus cereus group sp. TH152-1LC]PFJ25959.1 hypothetical protein COJ15_35135 [Bacillus thuringiensis]PGP11545.1 hypothetical protein COA01_35370 [Bacillus cereus]
MLKTISKQAKTIKRKKIIFTSHESQTKKQIPVIQMNTKKSLMKNLLISKLILESVSTENNEKIFTFKADLFDTLFHIKENLQTKTKVLYQDSFILDNNTLICNNLLQKFAA